jgi:N-acetylmuramoyl-L-alanine amidase
VGEAALDVQRRLLALGYPVGDDVAGSYGPGTTVAVAAFQERRGLRCDGVCGDDTWHALVEAGYRLGDRPLYLGYPLLRGDDVADLQRRLGSLGFDAGRVDGIFGPRTERALADFQRNGGLVTDAICGPATVAALRRLGGWADAPHSVASVREREQLRRGPRSLDGRTVAVGESGGLDALARAVAGAVTAAGGRALLIQHPDGSEQAAAANLAEVDAYVGLSLSASSVSVSTAYYRAPSGWESLEGRRLAEVVQALLPGILGATDGGVRGMALPVLRETRMPAVLAELGAASVVVERNAEVAATLAAALQRWIAQPAEV